MIIFSYLHGCIGCSHCTQVGDALGKDWESLQEGVPFPVEEQKQIASPWRHLYFEVLELLTSELFDLILNPDATVFLGHCSSL